ncbi:MAG: amidohydrolase [Roseburia sp.]|nr:amidohydrolase [Roseburia sp.]
MKSRNTRFYNAKILTLRKNHKFDIIEGELWVKDNTICYIGAGKSEERSFECNRMTKESQYNQNDREPFTWDREIDAKGNLLMPGFKNAHTHTAMTFLRSYADDLPLQKWLNEQVFPKEGQLAEQDAYWLNILGIMEYLTSGITSNFDMYIYPLMSAKAAVDTGFRMVHTSGLNNFVGNLDWLEESYHIINEMSDLTSFLLGFHAEYTTSKELMEGVAQLSHKLKSPVWLHNSETRAEVEECRQRWGVTPTQLTDSLGMYEYGGGGYHCVWLEEQDFEIFKKNKMTAVTNPASNLKLASGICPTKRFVDEGIAMAIGTDGPASNNCLDMFREMFLTSVLAKVREMDAECVCADEILYMATAGGAHAMQLDDCDSLAVGKKADIIMIDLQQPNMQPENNIVKNLVYSGSKQNVKMTMVNGRILYEDNKFDIGFEPAEIYRRANCIIRQMN